MKLKGEFVLRKIMEDVVAVPVGETTLRINGMVLLNDVSKVIWECLGQGCSLAGLVTAVTDAFEVPADVAETDILEFLQQLRQAELLDDQEENYGG